MIDEVFFVLVGFIIAVALWITTHFAIAVY